MGGRSITTAWRPLTTLSLVAERGKVPRRRRPGLFPPDSPLRRLATPTTLALAGGRSLLLELAHPSVAQAVADFDQFRDDPAERARLTVKAFRGVVHGTEEEARSVGRQLAGVHARVQGPTYRATDPDLVLWVHGSFLQSMLMVGQRLYGPLTPAGLERCYQDSMVVGAIFGCPVPQQPATYAVFTEYVATQVDQLQVSPMARELARAVFWPDVALGHRPVTATFRLISFGTLPQRLRRHYGFDLSPSHTAVLGVGRHVALPAAFALDHFFYAISNDGGRAVSTALALAGIKPEANSRTTQLPRDNSRGG
jgi:uncharacterized protein (DUF2236 family)